MTKIRYAKGPVVYLRDPDNVSKKRKQVLWGDWLRIGDDIDDDHSEVSWGRHRYAIRKDDYQKERLLEMIFLDVGQGDGCILTTPHTGKKEKVLIVDAGRGDNMKRYLDWRFRDFKKEYRFHAAVITHPDSDHYRGFQKIFENPRISFNHVYHNGLLERTGDDLLGPVQSGFLTDLRTTTEKARKLYADPDVRGGKDYPKLIWTALESGRVDEISMLSTRYGQVESDRCWMPEFGPSDQGELTIEVLGPVVERTPSGKEGLRTFARSLRGTAMNEGKTKNGHSVLLRLVYRDFSVLFGGDLNLPAEHFLLRHYGNDGKAPATPAETRAMVDRASARFSVDVMKSCHHGASDVSDEFLEATAPAAFIVSSGDEESYVHPRPDLLGLLGKKGRGPRPVVACTELLRSTREREDPKLRGQIDKLHDRILDETDATKRAELEEKRAALLNEALRRNVGVYGAINIRTDGRRALMAFRKEKGNDKSRWFYYELEQDADGVFQVKL